MKSLNQIDKLLYSILLAVLLVGVYIGISNETQFINKFVPEDGIIEYATAFLLLACSVLLTLRFFRLKNHKSIFWKIATLILAIILFFGFGEEISWGQRIFNIESSEFFNNTNLQGETNLHNLQFGDIKINKLIFSQLLGLIMMLYLILLPVIYNKIKWIKDKSNQFAIPIPKRHHTIAFLISLILVSIITTNKKWELFEFAFGIILFLIIYSPFNRKEIFT